MPSVNNGKPSPYHLILNSSNTLRRGPNVIGITLHGSKSIKYAQPQSNFGPTRPATPARDRKIEEHREKEAAESDAKLIPCHVCGGLKELSSSSTDEDGKDELIKPCPVHSNKPRTTTKSKQNNSHSSNTGKVFIIEDSIPQLQRSLVCRGWIQKYLPNQLQANLNKKGMPPQPIFSDEILHMYNPGFVWSYTNRNKFEFSSRSPYYSRLIIPNDKSHYSTKIGLTNIYERIYWYYRTENPTVTYPVSIVINDNVQKRSFFDQFRQTFFTSFLYYITYMGEGVFDVNGSISNEYARVALDEVRNFVYEKKHKDLDIKLLNLLIPISTHGMSKFKQIFCCIRRGEKIKVDDKTSRNKLMKEMRNALLEAMEFLPEIPQNGYHNVWILKPSTFHCGYGIVVMDDEQEIKNLIARNKDIVYIAQKYIERPLLVYKTKFDIRQFFLVVMDGGSLSVWVYKNNYLKFSGQEFTLDNLHTSIHITNQTAQARFKNSRARSNYLPNSNTWVLAQFLNYLTCIGKPTVWQDVIYPGIVESLLTIINGSMDDTIYTQRNFQLFGADFMISEDYQPILIEINPSPSLDYKTNSNRTVCAGVIEDMVKGKSLIQINSRHFHTFSYIISLQLSLIIPETTAAPPVISRECGASSIPQKTT